MIAKKIALDSLSTSTSQLFAPSHCMVVQHALAMKLITISRRKIIELNGRWLPYLLYSQEIHVSVLSPLYLHDISIVSTLLYL
jgi:hypothetical protein